MALIAAAGLAASVDSGVANAARPGDCPGAKPRTIVTTDGEADDINSMIRYLAYADCFKTLGLVYTSSMFHARPPGNLPLPAAPLPFSAYGRWAGTNWIQHLIELYGREYSHFKANDPGYPSPESLLSVVRVGNTDGLDNMWEDSPGVDLIRDLVLDPSGDGPLYIQTWGGMNSVARALFDIQQSTVLPFDPQGSVAAFDKLEKDIARRVVIVASGTGQDNTYNYIANEWPDIRVIDGSAGYKVWAYQHQTGGPSANPLPEDQEYYDGAWFGPNVVAAGPLGAYEYTYGDGHSAGDPYWPYWNDTSQPKYSFVSEGDNVAYLGLIPNGLNSADPTYGGWGGRQQLSSGNTWTNAASDTYTDGSQMAGYDVARWFPAAQNNFAARMKWGIADYARANHAPTVRVRQGPALTVMPGQTISLNCVLADPDGNTMQARWWQYEDAGTYPGAVTISSPRSSQTAVTVPADAKAGQTIHLILQAVDDGSPPMTSYSRVVLKVAG